MDNRQIAIIGANRAPNQWQFGVLGFTWPVDSRLTKRLNKTPVHAISFNVTFALFPKQSTGFVMMITRFWQIIRDDSKRTFEVCGQVANENSFTNKTYAMQKVGMNVSCMTPPVTNKTSSKSLIKITGYTKEDGLQERLLKKYAEISGSYEES